MLNILAFFFFFNKMDSVPPDTSWFLLNVLHLTIQIYIPVFYLSRCLVRLTCMNCTEETPYSVISR